MVCRRERERDREQSAVGCQSHRSGSTSSTADTRRAAAKKSLHQASSGTGEVRGTDQCIGCQHARLGLMPADHSEERRARIVRHMTADDDLSQRVQIAQQRIVGTAPSEAQAGERDSLSELARKKVRFAERVEEQTAEGSVPVIPRSTNSSSSICSSSSPTTIATSMQVDESDQDRAKRQTVVHGTDMGWSWRLSLIASNDTQTTVPSCKPSKTQIPTLTKSFPRIARREKLWRKTCYSSVCIHQFTWQKCFQILRKRVLSTGLVSPMGWRWSCGQDGT